MSGGSWEYAFLKIEDIADNLEASDCIHRRALGAYLRPAVNALHDIEWVDSFDLKKGEEIAAIKKCLGPRSNEVMLDVLSKKMVELSNAVEGICTAILEMKKVEDSDGSFRT